MQGKKMVENCVNIRLHTQADFKFLSSFFRDPLIIKENAGGSVLPEEKIAEFCNRSEENCKQQQCWMFTVLDEKTPVGCCLVRKNAKYGGFEIGFGILETEGAFSDVKHRQDARYLVEWNFKRNLIIVDTASVLRLIDGSPENKYRFGVLRIPF